ncbi:MAG: 2OG-Fe(II) oxygenase [Sulfitobacter sp.]
MEQYLDLETFPLDQPESGRYAGLIARCRGELANGGLFNLDGFLRPEYAQAEADALRPAMNTVSFNHQRRHNIYFLKSVPDLAPDHPALALRETSNDTLCADQLGGSIIERIYNWTPLVTFLSAVMEKPALFPMDDSLAKFNVMRYRTEQGLNWHFDRSEFTVTLLLQAPENGGVFEYRTDLRTADDPNYQGVAALLQGRDPQMQRMNVMPGTLNVFRGVNTPHRVTPVKGQDERMIAVLTYFEKPGAKFTEQEQLGFYGRIA